LGKKEYYWLPLIKIAQLGGIKKPIFTSTKKLSLELGCSQQTTSRILRQLSNEGFIERKVNFRGEYLKLTDKGLEELKNLYTTIHSILHAKKPEFLTVKGKVFSGLGEGAYYVTRKGYMVQFIRKLGFKPYPGTLNLKLLSQQDILARKELEKLEGITIDGFSDGQRTYGMLKCYPSLVDDKVKGAVLLIQRTHYNSSVLEVIAPTCLREKLNLKDGDVVKLKVFI